jgi:hypothetical protein
MTKWIPHYTGIESCEQELVRLLLYRQRDRKTGEFIFVWLTLGRRSIGAFLKSRNYGSRLFVSGVGLFTNCFALVLGRRKLRGCFFSTYTSGSMIKFYTATVAALGSLGIAFNSSEWLIRLYSRRKATGTFVPAGDDAVVYDIELDAPPGGRELRGVHGRLGR